MLKNIVRYITEFSSYGIMGLPLLRSQFVLRIVDCCSSCRSESFGLPCGLTQRFLPLLDEFLTALRRLIQDFAPTIDGVIKFIFGACSIVAKKPARPRTRLRREKQRETRTDQRS